MTSLPASTEHPLDRVDLRARVAKALDDVPGVAAADAGRHQRGPRTARAGHRRVRRRRQAAAPGVLLLGLARRRRRGLRRDHDRGGRARAAPGVRAGPRRRDGRQRHPPGRARRTPRFAALHRGAGWHGDPERSASQRRSCSATCAWSGPTRCSTAAACRTEALLRAQPGLRPDAHRADGRPVPRPLEQARAAASVERALRVARYKAAKYTIERPLLIGRAARGGAPEARGALTPYGLPLGEAFQLRDDVLGVFGDPGETGKPAGDDLREGKRTVLVAAALTRADQPAGGGHPPPPRRPGPGHRRASRRCARSSPRPAPWQRSSG